MRFRAFYTSIYNICLGFIKIESKTDIKEARAKSAKKTGSPRRGIPSLISGAKGGQNMVSCSPRRRFVRLGELFT